MKTINVVLCSVVLLSPLAGAQGLKIKKGTVTLGGSVGFSVDTIMPEKGDSVSGVLFELSPSVGYFFNENYEFRGSLFIKAGGGDLYEGINTEFGFTLGVVFYRTIGRIKPYIGCDLGLLSVFPDDGNNTEAFLLSIPVGLLVAMNEYVAIDVGARFDVVMSLEDGGGSGIRIPIGYGGLRAFF